MNNKIAIAVTVLALVGVFIINQEPSKQTNESSATPNHSQPKATELALDAADANYAQPAQLSQTKVAKTQIEVVESDNQPLPPPPPVGVPPMASPANERGVISHPNQQAPIQAPVSRSTPRKE